MGFPNRPSRQAFGPNPVNRRPVRNPAQELDGETIGRLMFWQLSGAGLVVPGAWIYCTVAAGVLTLVAHQESWNPAGELAAPLVARTSQGLYTAQYPAVVPDEQGVDQSVNLLFAQVFPQAATSRFGIPERVDGQNFRLRVRDDAGAVQDSDFAAFFW